jgi:predicted RNase H-like HicB family nuclease
MRSLTAIVEKTSDGFSGYLDTDLVGVASVAETIHELKQNLKEALAMALEDLEDRGKDVSQIKTAQIRLTLDVKQFFEFYKTINLSAFADFLKMNRSLLNQYAKGIKKPSEKQSMRILEGIHRLGKEYSEVRF